MAMSYDELKDKALERYGHIDSIPNDVYNALKSYQNNGNAALDDDNTFKILSDIKSYIAQPTSTTYKEQAPGLLARVKETGYTGLSDNDKRLFDAQYPHSQASKSISLEEARRLADDEARKEQNRKEKKEQGQKILDIGKALYDGSRSGFAEVFGRATGIPEGIAEYALGSKHEEKDGKAIKLPEKKLKQVIDETIEENIKGGSEGKGVTGALSDPLNIIAEAVYPAKVGQVLLPAIKQGVASGTSEIINTEKGKDISWSDVGSRALGSTLGSLAAGSVLSIPAARLQAKNIEREGVERTISHLGKAEADNVEKIAELSKKYDEIQKDLLNWKPDFKNKAKASKELGAAEHLLEAKNKMVVQNDVARELNAARDKAERLSERYTDLQATKQAIEDKTIFPGAKAVGKAVTRPFATSIVKGPVVDKAYSVANTKDVSETIAKTLGKGTPVGSLLGSIIGGETSKAVKKRIEEFNKVYEKGKEYINMFGQ